MTRRAVPIGRELFIKELASKIFAAGYSNLDTFGADGDRVWARNAIKAAEAFAEAWDERNGPAK